MVGRLVEDEQVGPGEQRAGERDAALFSAGKLARQPVGGGRAEVHGERADAVLDVPAVEMIDVVEHLARAGGFGRLVLVGFDQVETTACAPVRMFSSTVRLSSNWKSCGR